MKEYEDMAIKVGDKVVGRLLHVTELIGYRLLIAIIMNYG
jgi:hypothetical protein